MIADRYYYNRLSDVEKRIYQSLYKGIVVLKEQIQVPISISQEDMIRRIFSALTCDNPHLYYFDECYIQWEYTDAYSKFYPRYLYDKEQIIHYNEQIEKTVNHIVSSLDLASLKDVEKEKRIHDYLISRIRYDMEAYASQNQYQITNAHTILGVFLDQKAVCEGISKAVKLLMNTVNIACIIVNGSSKTDGYEHAWNIIKIKDRAYHLDVTWDLNQSTIRDISYDYFNVSDRQIKKDHVFSQDLPKCPISDTVHNVRYKHKPKRF